MTNNAKESDIQAQRVATHKALAALSRKQGGLFGWSGPANNRALEDAGISYGNWQDKAGFASLLFELGFGWDWPNEQLYRTTTWIRLRRCEKIVDDWTHDHGTLLIEYCDAKTDIVRRTHINSMVAAWHGGSKPAPSKTQSAQSAESEQLRAKQQVTARRLADRVMSVTRAVETQRDDMNRRLGFISDPELRNRFQAHQETLTSAIALCNGLVIDANTDGDAPIASVTPDRADHAVKQVQDAFAALLVVANQAEEAQALEQLETYVASVGDENLGSW